MKTDWRRLARFCGLLSLLLLLQACAILRPAPEIASGGGDQVAWQERQASLTAINQWRVKARMASGVIGWSGNLDWRQQDANLVFSVAGPLGVGGVRAVGTLDLVEVETSDGERYRGDPEMLFNALVGWPFPVKGMRYWALGLPMPTLRAETELDTEGLLRVLRQAGWQVEYLEYRDYLGYHMPRLMRLDNGEITVRVVVDKWLELSERT